MRQLLAKFIKKHFMQMLFNRNIEVSLLKGLVIVMISWSDNWRNVLNKNGVVVLSDVDFVQKDVDAIEQSSVIRKKCNRDKDQDAVKHIYDLQLLLILRRMFVITS